MSALVHQQQPTWYSCNQTVLAMLLGVPVDEVLRVFPTEGMVTRELYAALDRCGFTWNAFMFGTLVTEGFYILGVPSLNLEAGGHTILLEWHGSDEPSVVYDPNRGKVGKRFYTAGNDEGGIPLRWWTDVIYVCRDGKLPVAQEKTS